MATWETGWVTADDVVAVLAQYDKEDRWNGWLCPSMDPLAVMDVVEPLTEDLEYGVYVEWQEDGSLAVYDRQDPEVPEVVRPDVDGLYALGAYAWTWHRVDDPELVEDLGSPDRGVEVYVDRLGRVILCPGCMTQDEVMPSTWEPGIPTDKTLVCGICGEAFNVNEASYAYKENFHLRSRGDIVDPPYRWVVVEDE